MQETKILKKPNKIGTQIINKENKFSNNLTKLNNKDLTKFNSKNLTKDFTSSFNNALTHSLSSREKYLEVETSLKLSDFSEYNINQFLNYPLLALTKGNAYRKELTVLKELTECPNVLSLITDTVTTSYNKQLESINNRTNTVLNVMQDETESLILSKDAQLSTLEEEKNKQINDLHTLVENKDDEINRLSSLGNKFSLELNERIKKEQELKEEKLKTLKDKADLDVINEKYITLEKEAKLKGNLIEILNNKILEYSNLIYQKQQEKEIIISEYSILNSQYGLLDLSKISFENQASKLENELKRRDESLKSLEHIKNNEIARINDILTATVNRLTNKNFEIGNLNEQIINKNNEINTLQETLTQITNEKNKFKKKYRQSTLTLDISQNQLKELNKLRSSDKFKLNALLFLDTSRSFIPFKWYGKLLTTVETSIFVSRAIKHDKLEKTTWLSLFIFTMISFTFTAYKSTKFFIFKVKALFSRKKKITTPITAA